MTDKSSALLIHVLLFLRGLTPIAASEDFDDLWSTWSDLIRYLLGLFFVILGLHLLLYTPFSVHVTWKQYLTQKAYSRKVLGDILSCTKINNSPLPQFEVSVLYTARVNPYANNHSRSRMEFRHPDKFVEKRFIRRFVISCFLPRKPQSVDVLFLPGMPRSGCLAEVAERKVAEYSRCRTFLLLILGIFLIGVFILLASVEVREMEDKELGWAVLVCTLLLFVGGIRLWCESQFMKTKRKIFDSAVAFKIVDSNSMGGKSAPLLSQQIPVVQGLYVV